MIDSSRLFSGGFNESIETGVTFFSVSPKRGRRGVNSGGEEEAEDEPHTPLPPPMEIIKDPSAQEEKVKHKLALIFHCCFVLFHFFSA